jgi:histidine triad (HIT) family protein
MTTLFSKIIRGEVSCEKVYENEHIFAFKDIHPRAPVHILIVTKKTIPDLQSVEPGDLFLMGEVMKAVQFIAKEYNLQDGYRLVTNNGPAAGQTVFHLHFHLLGGKKMDDL